MAAGPELAAAVSNAGGLGVVGASGTDAQGMPALVALSAPTALAIRTADRGGLMLVALDRAGEPLVYSAVDASPLTI